MLPTGHAAAGSMDQYRSDVARLEQRLMMSSRAVISVDPHRSASLAPSNDFGIQGTPAAELCLGSGKVVAH